MRKRAAPRAAGAAAIVALAAVGAGALGRTEMTRSPRPLPVETPMPPFSGATAWINSAPLTPEALRGKVVVVDFWTFTCVNWLRTLPYVRAWAAKYRDKGLVVVGVHSPEFSVEKNLDNVRRAVKEMRIDYPVAVDTDFAVWRAFDNAYWPALYVVDARGRVRFHHFGEGEYERSERVIQELLVEAGATGVGRELAAVAPQGTEVAADWSEVRSGESYVGYAKAVGFASPGGLARDAPGPYSIPVRLAPNQWALSGDWVVGEEIAAPQKAGGRIAYRFHARDLNLVMGTPAGAAPVRYRVLIDGHPPGPAHGADVDGQGNGQVSEPRLYQLIRQPKPIEDRVFEIEFMSPGVQAFCFTFG